MLKTLHIYLNLKNSEVSQNLASFLPISKYKCLVQCQKLNNLYFPAQQIKNILQ